MNTLMLEPGEFGHLSKLSKGSQPAGGVHGPNITNMVFNLAQNSPMIAYPDNVQHMTAIAGAKNPQRTGGNPTSAHSRQGSFVGDRSKSQGNQRNQMVNRKMQQH